jgi:hypothetical protein
MSQIGDFIVFRSRASPQFVRFVRRFVRRYRIRRRDAKRGSQHGAAHFARQNMPASRRAFALAL